MDFDVVGIGQCALDYLAEVDKYPDLDDKVELDGIKVEGGGPTATAMVTLSRLNVNTAFIGKVGDDDPGEKIIGGLRREGVDTNAVVVESGKSSQLAFIVVEKDSAKRNIFFTRGTAAPLTFYEINTGIIDTCSILHLDGLMIDVSIEAAKYAKKRGIKVSLDAGTLRDGMMDLIKHTDYLVTSEKFAKSFIGGADFDSALHELKKLGPEIVGITLGHEGSIALKDGTIHRQPAYKVDAVDTTGAGDVYHGAFIYAMLKRFDIKRTLAFASFMAGMKCRALGGRSAIPRAAECDII
ncbi:carbohydrate kinase family protein [Thermodesulfobacteriota bacterium]